MIFENIVESLKEPTIESDAVFGALYSSIVPNYALDSAYFLETAKLEDFRQFLRRTPWVLPEDCVIVRMDKECFKQFIDDAVCHCYFLCSSFGKKTTISMMDGNRSIIVLFLNEGEDGSDLETSIQEMMDKKRLADVLLGKRLSAYEPIDL